MLQMLHKGCNLGPDGPHLLTTVACLVIGARGSNMAWSVAVVAQPCVIGWEAVFTISSQVAHPPTYMANRNIVALTSHMTRSFAILARCLCSTFKCNVPRTDNMSMVCAKRHQALIEEKITTFVSMHKF